MASAKVIKRHATHSLVHTRHVCSGKSAQIAGSWRRAHLRARAARRCTALRVLPLAARAAPRRDQPSLRPQPVQPARRVWPQRGPHPRGLGSDMEAGAARRGTLPAGALGTMRCGAVGLRRSPVRSPATRRGCSTGRCRHVLPWRRPAAPPSAGAALAPASGIASARPVPAGATPRSARSGRGDAVLCERNSVRGSDRLLSRFSV